MNPWTKRSRNKFLNIYTYIQVVMYLCFRWESEHIHILYILYTYYIIYSIIYIYYVYIYIMYAELHTHSEKDDFMPWREGNISRSVVEPSNMRIEARPKKGRRVRTTRFGTRMSQCACHQCVISCASRLVLFILELQSRNNL